jgi:hypothetical protein
LRRLIGGFEILVETGKTVVNVPHLQIAVHPETVAEGIPDFGIIGEIIFLVKIKLNTI